ncbi:hypothetical protein NTGHW29_930018 [Candidatus Nitrotoga sp. HW29]|uniref:hypothetical protein n=1 Tax=Candidatus Nitrotoga sp. HW29 TaxID=2886963 RepID=UPI001EF3AB96|nr:hypothetical protein [Candidatus Nitrotoga sp. HW29]CAH1906457.1 hypothetical protein NTGHW29_930018 [Candidatus Nitrotoga sp. HW29]
MLATLKAIVLSLLIAFAGYPSPARAIEISSKLTVKGILEFGIAPETRALIESLPTNIREQVFILLQQSLPLIDKSVLKYIDALNSKLLEQQMFLDCTIDGAMERAITDLRNVGLFSDQYQGMIAKLQIRVDALPTSLKSSSTIKDIRQAYADLLTKARSAQCANRDVPFALKEIAPIISELSSGYITWARLESLECFEPTACISLLKARVTEQIRTNDPRDLEQSKAISRLDAVKAPRQTKWPFKKYDFNPYEDILSELFSISDQMRMATYIRSTSAQSNIDDAQNIANAYAEATQRSRSLMNGSLAQRRTAVAIASQADDSAARIQPILTLAVETLPSTKKRADEILASFPSLVSERGIVAAQSKSLLSAMEAEYEQQCYKRCPGSRNELCPSRRPIPMSQCI